MTDRTSCLYVCVTSLVVLAVQLHVLTPTQTVTLVCDATPDVVGDRRDSMTSFLSDVTSAAVGVDLIRDCETRQ